MNKAGILCYAAVAGMQNGAKCARLCGARQQTCANAGTDVVSLVHPHVSCPPLLILYHISSFFSSLLWPSVTELGFKSKKRPQLHLLTFFLIRRRHYLSPESLIRCTHWTRWSAFSFCVYSAQDRIPSPNFPSSLWFRLPFPPLV